MLRFGLLYPTRGAGEDDFVALAARTDPSARVDPIYFPWPRWVSDLADLDTEDTYRAIRELGSTDHLRAVLPPLLDGLSTPSATIFGVTSSSFLLGAAGVQEQLSLVTELTGSPSTSTTVAFQQASATQGFCSPDGDQLPGQRIRSQRPARDRGAEVSVSGG